MPKLWNATIEAHRREVRDAILDTTARLAGEHGLLHVTMSQIAATTGIGRATLYKYFSSVDDILDAWHQRRVTSHLALLTETAERDAPALERLTSVLRVYARIRRHRTDHGDRPHAVELAAFLHRDDELAPAEHQLRGLVAGLLDDAIAARQVRSDIPPEEAADYCLHALNAAASMPSDAAVGRLVDLILEGLRPRG